MPADTHCLASCWIVPTREGKLRGALSKIMALQCFQMHHATNMAMDVPFGARGRDRVAHLMPPIHEVILRIWVSCCRTQPGKNLVPHHAREGAASEEMSHCLFRLITEHATRCTLKASAC